MQVSNNKSRTKYIMSFGHFSADFVQGALSATLPFLIAGYGLTYAEAAMLVMISNIAGSVIQPVFGHISDKIDKPHFMTIGVIMAGVGIAAIGFITDYWLLCLSVIVSGMGVAVFHPQGASMVRRRADESTMGVDMGIFSFGGNAGFTLGPIIGASVFAIAGLHGTAAFILPAVIFTVLMFLHFGAKPQQAARAAAQKAADAVSAGIDRWGEFAKVCLYVCCRSIIFSGMSTFLILYFMEAFGLGEGAGSVLLSIYFGVSAVASLFGGKLADIIGFRKVLIMSSMILVVGLVLFNHMPGVAASVAVLILIGIGISIGYSSMVTLGQKALPNHVGFASGITLGFSVTVGGIVAPFLGNLGDHYGLTVIFPILAATAAVSLIAGLILREK